jgi:hypothetical protein
VPACEKGAVEDEIGRWARGLVEALHAALAAAKARDDAHSVGGPAEASGRRPARELPLLAALPNRRASIIVSS